VLDGRAIDADVHDEAMRNVEEIHERLDIH
jgi:hypothetical protein